MDQPIIQSTIIYSSFEFEFEPGETQFISVRVNLIHNKSYFLSKEFGSKSAWARKRLNDGVGTFA